MGHYNIKLSNNYQYYWVLKANNNEIICVSETYIHKQGALRGIDACKRLSPFNENYFLFQGHDGQYYWHLKAQNGEIVAQSEGYKEKQGALNGIASCKVNGPNSSIKDETTQSAYT